MDLRQLHIHTVQYSTGSSSQSRIDLWTITFAWIWWSCLSVIKYHGSNCKASRSMKIFIKLLLVGAASLTLAAEDGLRGLQSLNVSLPLPVRAAVKIQASANYEYRPTKFLDHLFPDLLRSFCSSRGTTYFRLLKAKSTLSSTPTATCATILSLAHCFIIFVPLY
jgi:hypothetical protein